MCHWHFQLITWIKNKIGDDLVVVWIIWSWHTQTHTTHTHSRYTACRSTNKIEYSNPQRFICIWRASVAFEAKKKMDFELAGNLIHWKLIFFVSEWWKQRAENNKYEYVIRNHNNLWIQNNKNNNNIVFKQREQTESSKAMQICVPGFVISTAQPTKYCKK